MMHHVFLFFFFLSLLRIALADATCNPIYTWYSWSKNAKGQDPCQVASLLFPTCNFGNSLGPLSNTSAFYPGPPANVQNDCICSYPVYNLLMACGDCQVGIQAPGAWPPYDVWSSACTPDNRRTVLPFDPTAITALPPWALITNTTSGDPRWSYGLSFALSAGTVVLNPNPPTNTNPPTQTGTLTVTISGASASATGAGTGTGTTTGTGTGAGGGVGITTGSPSTTTGAVVTADPLCSAACVRGGPSAAAIGIGAAAGGLLLGALLVALVCLCCLRRRERKAREREETTTYPDLSPRPVGAAAYTSPTPGSSFGNHIRPNRAGVQRPDMYEVQRPYDPFAPSTPSASQHSASLHSRHTGHTGYTGGGVPFPMPHPNEIEPANALHLQTHPPSMIGTGGPPERTPRVSFTTVNVTHHSESSPVIEVDPERTPPGYRRRMI